MQDHDSSSFKPTRIALGIEYDGTKFHGWQSQPNVRTVQGVVEHALSTVANEKISTICAGRTDGGVHAASQVIHFESHAKRLEDAWVLGSNCYLPSDVKVQWAHIVEEDFHARFSALSRTYQYWIYCSRVRPVMLRSYLTHEERRFDLALMEQVAQQLVGEHDFSAFCASECQAKTPIRTVENVSIFQQGPLISFTITANAFLHHMVRKIVAVLLEISSGRRPISWMDELMANRQSANQIVMAPPQGLCLVAVRYPSRFNLPQAKGAWLHFGEDSL